MPSNPTKREDDCPPQWGRKGAEALLAASKAEAARLRVRYETIPELLRGWVWETDAEHRFTYLSPSVKKILGRPPEFHYGKTREELGLSLLREEQRASYRDQIDQHDRFGPIEFRQSFDGSKVRWLRTTGAPQFDETGAFTGYCGIAYDITVEVQERQKREDAELARQRSLDILKTTIDCFPSGISVIDADRRIAFANDKFFEYLGLPQGKFPAGTPVDELFAYMQQRGDFWGGGEEVAHHLQTIASGQALIYERTRPNGTRLVIKCAPLPGGGQVRTYIDVTHRYEQQWRLEAAIQELRSKVRVLEGKPGLDALSHRAPPRAAACAPLEEAHASVVPAVGDESHGGSASDVCAG